MAKGRRPRIEPVNPVISPHLLSQIKVVDPKMRAKIGYIEYPFDFEIRIFQNDKVILEIRYLAKYLTQRQGISNELFYGVGVELSFDFKRNPYELPETIKEKLSDLYNNIKAQYGADTERPTVLTKELLATELNKLEIQVSL